MRFYKKDDQADGIILLKEQPVEKVLQTKDKVAKLWEDRNTKYSHISDDMWDAGIKAVSAGAWTVDGLIKRFEWEKIYGNRINRAMPENALQDKTLEKDSVPSPTETSVISFFQQFRKTISELYGEKSVQGLFIPDKQEDRYVVAAEIPVPKGWNGVQRIVTADPVIITIQTGDTNKSIAQRKGSPKKIVWYVADFNNLTDNEIKILTHEIGHIMSSGMDTTLRTKLTPLEIKIVKEKYSKSATEWTDLSGQEYLEMIEMADERRANGYALWVADKLKMPALAEIPNTLQAYKVKYTIRTELETPWEQLEGVPLQSDEYGLYAGIKDLDKSIEYTRAQIESDKLRREEEDRILKKFLQQAKQEQLATMPTQMSDSTTDIPRSGFQSWLKTGEPTTIKYIQTIPKERLSEFVRGIYGSDNKNEYTPFGRARMNADTVDMVWTMLKNQYLLIVFLIVLPAFPLFYSAEYLKAPELIFFSSNFFC